MIETLRMQRRTLGAGRARGAGRRHGAVRVRRRSRRRASSGQRLRSRRHDPWLGRVVAGTRKQAVGHKAGDEFTSTRRSRPTSACRRSPARRPTSTIKIVRVQEPQLPEIDEAFAASFGIKEGGLAKFREDVRANLERELKGVLMGRLKSEDGREARRCVSGDRAAAGDDRERCARARAPGAAQAQQQSEQFRAGCRSPAARRRVAAGFLLAELARQNEVRLDSRRVTEALATIASTYEEPEKVVELYTARSPVDAGPAESRARRPGRRMGRRACQADRAAR